MRTRSWPTSVPRQLQHWSSQPVQQRGCLAAGPQQLQRDLGHHRLAARLASSILSARPRPKLRKLAQ